MGDDEDGDGKQLEKRWRIRDARRDRSLMTSSFVHNRGQDRQIDEVF